MAILLTLDASVFVAACRTEEPGYSTSKALLSAVRSKNIPLVEPALLPVETAAALRRTGTSPADALSYALSIPALPRLIMAQVDMPLATRSAQLACECGLRGADAIYAAVAELYGTVLVTLDQKQLARSPKSIKACTPDSARRLILK